MPLCFPKLFLPWTVVHSHRTTECSLIFLWCQFCDLFFHCSNLGDDPAKQVREAVAQVIGIMACICNYSTDSSTKDSPPTVQASFLTGSKQFGSAHDRVGFTCLECDGASDSIRGGNYCQDAALIGDKGVVAPLATFQPLFGKLLFNETSESVQVGFFFIAFFSWAGVWPSYTDFISSVGWVPGLEGRDHLTMLIR
jgi:hypothetical protein